MPTSVHLDYTKIIPSITQENNLIFPKTHEILPDTQKYMVYAPQNKINLTCGRQCMRTFCVTRHEIYMTCFKYMWFDVKRCTQRYTVIGAKI